MPTCLRGAVFLRHSVFRARMQLKIVNVDSGYCNTSQINGHSDLWVVVPSSGTSVLMTSGGGLQVLDGIASR